MPWLIDRKTLGLPEYPDYIYEMITKYNLPIDAIYLDGGMSWLYRGPWKWAPSYEIYPIIGRTKGVIPGFELVDYRYENESYAQFNLPSIVKDIAVYRRIPGFDFSKLNDPPTSYDPTDPNVRFRFASGFGEIGSFDGSPVIFASDEIQYRYRYRPDRLKPWADQDITFQVKEGHKPTAVTLDAYILGKTQIYSYLNLDVDIFDKPQDRTAKRVTDIFIEDKGWQHLRFPLPADQLHDGLNKIGFRFSAFNHMAVCNTAADAATHILIRHMDPKTCFRIDGNALPTGILSDKDKTNLGADFGEMQKDIVDAVGTMLVRKVTFEY